MANGANGPILGASLTYYIFEGVLVGTIGGNYIHEFALSGGGGGSTQNTPSGSANNPYSEGLKTSGKGLRHQHGGPIPPGRYIIHQPTEHAHLGLSAYLEPAGGNMMGRDGFFIHGRGSHGSDGCVVPLSNFTSLMAALGREGGGVLFVQEAMGGARFA
jgi:hypothetical protein